MPVCQGGFIFFHYILVLVGGLLWRPKVVVKQNNRGPTFQSSTIHPPLSTIHPLQIHYEHPPSTIHPPPSTLHYPPSTIYSYIFTKPQYFEEQPTNQPTDAPTNQPTNRPTNRSCLYNTIIRKVLLSA